MKTLTQLTATLGDAPAVAPPDIRHNIADEPTPGFFRAMSIGHAGLQARIGAERILIPSSELWALVEQHCPAFRPPPKSSTAVPAESPVPNPKSKI